MIKMIALLRRKPGLSRAAFQDYYETRHVPLITEQQGPTLIEYRRNYLLDGAMIAGADDGDVDVVTECCYADRAGFEAALQRLSTPEASARRDHDEQQFLDVSAIRVFTVETRG